MTGLRLRLDPTVPLCWENLDTLRLGFERVRARIPAADHGVQRLLSALRDGFAAEELTSIVQRCGIGQARADALLSALEPELLGASPPEPAAVRAVLDEGGFPVPGLREALAKIEFLEIFETADTSLSGAQRSSGIPETEVPAPVPAPRAPNPDVAILAERFIEPSERAQRWLMAGVPHLSVRFSDSLLEVGPLVGPAGAPCHACTVLTRVARDPALPVLAAQLMGRRAATEQPTLARLAAVTAEQLLRAWRAGDPRVHSTAHRFPVGRSGVTNHGTTARIAAHPDCACTDLTPPAGSGAVPNTGAWASDGASVDSRISRSCPPPR